MAADFRQAPLEPVDFALAEYAWRLTRAPWTVTSAHIAALRGEGLSDVAIHDACQAAAYFNYINRIADGLGVDLEDFMPPEPEDWKREPEDVDGSETARARDKHAQPFITTIATDEATGLLRELYDAALARSARIANILRVMSVNPSTLKAALDFHASVMLLPVSLRRDQLEQIGIAVSRVNRCYYSYAFHEREMQAHRASEAAPETAVDRALREMAVQLTIHPWRMGASDLQRLRALRLSEVAIHDAYQAAAFFNYANRIVLGLGVPLEPDFPPEPPDWDDFRAR